VESACSRFTSGYRIQASKGRRPLIMPSLGSRDARRHHGPEGLGANHHTDGADPGNRLKWIADGSGRPESPEEWEVFHEAVERLPAEERRITEMLWYRGLTHAQAAEALGVATRMVQRRWASARLMIRDALDGDRPT
jgi:RNA polymerase sigma-70 factor (ECF subfamily)